MLLLFAVLLGALCAFVGVAMARTRHRSETEGFAWGCLLGPLGLAILAAKGDSRPLRDCPHCAESILAAARTCRHCGRDVEPVAGSVGGRPGRADRLRQARMERLQEERAMGRLSKEEYDEKVRQLG